jgi:P27 family predicted phage terminase small subunit
MKGRRPKSQILKLVTGNPGRRPLKPGLAIDPPSTLPDPPDFLSDDAQKEWRRVVPALVALRLFSTLDVAALAAYCTACGTWRQAMAALRAMAETDAKYHGLVVETKHGNLIQNPLLGIANKAAADMVKFGSEFGLSPTARARLSPSGIETRPEDEGEKYFR